MNPAPQTGQDASQVRAVTPDASIPADPAVGDSSAPRSNLAPGAAAGATSDGAIDPNAPAMGPTAAFDASSAKSPVVVMPRRGVSTQAYLRQAAMTNQFEIAAGQVAEQRAGSDPVRQFAQTMVQQHTQASQILAQAAGQAGLAVPSGLDADHRTMLRMLKSTPKAKFDAVYMGAQLSGHMQAAALQEGYARDGDNPALQQAARQIEPLVQHHLDMAWSLTGGESHVAKARQAEMTAVAQNSRGATYRGYSVIGPSRGAKRDSNDSSDTSPAALSAPSRTQDRKSDGYMGANRADPGQAASNPNGAAAAGAVGAAGPQGAGTAPSDAGPGYEAQPGAGQTGASGRTGPSAGYTDGNTPESTTGGSSRAAPGSGQYRGFTSGDPSAANGMSATDEASRQFGFSGPAQPGPQSGSTSNSYVPQSDSALSGSVPLGSGAPDTATTTTPAPAPGTGTTSPAPAPTGGAPDPH